MKKILLVAMLATLAIGGIFAKGKKSKPEEKLVEVAAEEFFSSNFAARKGTVYKITNLNLTFNINENLIASCPGWWDFWDSLSEILTTEEKNRIKKAGEHDEYQPLRKNYIVYVQTTTAKPELENLKVIKIENIPTDEDFAKEDGKARLIAEKKAEEERQKAERAEEERKKLEEKKAALRAKARKEGGFDDMPWGTTYDDFSNFYPNAKELESDGSIARYKIESDQYTKIYKFYENTLVGGVTVYSDISDEKSNDINVGLKQLYGKPSDTRDLSKHKSESFTSYDGIPYSFSYTDYHFRVIWNKSPTFKIQYDLTAREIDDGFGVDFMTKAMINRAPEVTITYSNEQKMAAIKSNDEKKKKAADAEAQKKRVDNLGL